MTENPVVLTLKIGNRNFTLHGTLRVDEGAISSPTQVQRSVDVSIPDPEPHFMSQREMIQTKSPANHSETIAVLAFSLMQSGQDEFTAADIKRAYILAGARPPKVIDQAIRDAKNQYGYVERASKRGSYRLSNHGERVVRFDLPRTNQ